MQVSLLVDPHAGADDSYKTAYPEAAKAFHPKDIGFLKISNTAEGFNVSKVGFHWLDIHWFERWYT